MKSFVKNITLMALALSLKGQYATAQTPTYSLQQLKETALKSNHILSVKQWQIAEREAKIKEDETKRYPTATVNGNYQYNFNLANITIPAGSIGVLPVSSTVQVPLPNEDKNIQIGNKNLYNLGVTAYQPISQQIKIKTGLEVNRMDVAITEKEKQKIALQITQGVEQLYYGTLIAQKQLEEAEAKLAVAKAKLGDVETAIAAGKTIDVNQAGLLANIADEEQNILKLSIQAQNYKSDLVKLTGIADEDFNLQESSFVMEQVAGIENFKNASSSNPDIQIASLTKEKAQLGIKAAQQSTLPDFGFVTGYTYQSGNPILPNHNPFVGLNLKWNVQDLFSNKHLLKQREAQAKQAEENILNLQQQVTSDIEKAYRKVNQSKSLIAVAQRVLDYRTKELKVQEDKQVAGLNVKTDILNTKALVAKANADVYAAQLAYTLAVSELKSLIGNQ